MGLLEESLVLGYSDEVDTKNVVFQQDMDNTWQCCCSNNIRKFIKLGWMASMTLFLLSKYRDY